MEVSKKLYQRVTRTPEEALAAFNEKYPTAHAWIKDSLIEDSFQGEIEVGSENLHFDTCRVPLITYEEVAVGEILGIVSQSEPLCRALREIV